jgi:hypothetical protein
MIDRWPQEYAYQCGGRGRRGNELVGSEAVSLLVLVNSIGGTDGARTGEERRPRCEATMNVVEIDGTRRHRHQEERERTVLVGGWSEVFMTMDVRGELEFVLR